MAAITGVDRERFEQAYWRHRRAYDLGRRATDYWRDTLHDLGVTDHAVLESLIDLDVQSWTRYREPMWTLARTVRAAGVKTAILSNGVPEVMARVRADRPLAETLRRRGGLVRARPRETRSRDLPRPPCSKLGVVPQDALFVDDRGENIAAADTLGLRTFHFTGDDRFGRFQAYLTEELSK